MKNKFITPPRNLSRLAGKAIEDCGMICDGDRTLPGLSGDKDNLSLLHMLHRLQSKSPAKYN